MSWVLKLAYTGWAKKSKPDNFCNNFVYCQPIFIIFGIYILCRKFATRGYIVSPPTLLNLDHDLFQVKFYSLSQKSQVVTSVAIIANFCRIIFKRIIPDEYYLFSSNGYALAAV